jgi:sec-independent protein translocase protein TatC
MARKKEDKREEMSFLDHLEELRWHIVRSAMGAFVFMIVAFVNRNFIFNEVILKPRNPDFFTNRLFMSFGEWLNKNYNIDPSPFAINTQPLNIVNIDMAGQFTSHFRISIVVGLILACPYIVWEIWRFISPALHAKERKYASGAVFFISSLFLLGVLFGYYLIAPLSIHFLNTYIVSEQVVNTIKLNSYISTITSVTFASGVIFELPIIALFLSKIGMLTPGFMRKYRKHAYVVLLIIAGIITPPDVFSQVLVCIPLVLLYEISVFISRSVEKKKEKERLKEEMTEPAKSADDFSERTYINGDDN